MEVIIKLLMNLVQTNSTHAIPKVFPRCKTSPFKTSQFNKYHDLNRAERMGVTDSNVYSRQAFEKYDTFAVPEKNFLRFYDCLSFVTKSSFLIFSRLHRKFNYCRFFFILRESCNFGQGGASPRARFFFSKWIES